MILDERQLFFKTLIKKQHTRSASYNRTIVILHVKRNFYHVTYLLPFYATFLSLVLLLIKIIFINSIIPSHNLLRRELNIASLLCVCMYVHLCMCVRFILLARFIENLRTNIYQTSYISLAWYKDKSY